MDGKTKSGNVSGCVSMLNLKLFSFENTSLNSFVTKLMRFIAKTNSIRVVGFVKKQVCLFVC